MKRPLFSWIACAFTFVALTGTAQAGGFTLSDRGVRAIGRGNAFVAGADDPNALWYNPAGLGWSGRQLFVDASLNMLQADFTRIDSGGNRQATVSNNFSPIPIPGLAYSDHFGLRDLTFGIGAFAPNASMLDWPEQIDIGGTSYPAPQRYSLLTMNGSLLMHAALGVAWRPSFAPGLSLGFSGGIVLGTFNVRTTLGACDRALCTQPENPEYDAVSEALVENAVAPHINFGAIYEVGMFRFGLSAAMGYKLAGEAKLRVRLPSAAPFDDARTDGDRADMSLDFPWIVRSGIELRPVDGLRTEIAFAWEGWSTQRDLTITPKNVWLRGVTAVGDYQVGPIVVPRNMRDTYSIRFGVEYRHPGSWWTVRGGVQYETSAFDDAHLTVLTLDSDKVIASLGGAFEVTEGLFIDVSFAHAVMTNRQVRDSVVPQANPIRPASYDTVYVGNGDYAMDATMVGLGVRWQLAASPRDVPPETVESTEDPRESSSSDSQMP